MSYLIILPIYNLGHSVKLSKSIENILSSLKLIPKHGRGSKEPAVFLNDIAISITAIDLSGKSPLMSGYKIYRSFLTSLKIKNREKSFSIKKLSRAIYNLVRDKS